MKAMNMMRAMMAMLMIAASMNMMAQGRRGGNNDMAAHRGANREMVVNGRGGVEFRGHGSHTPQVHIDAHRPAPVVVSHHTDHGRWAGRVRHMDDGRWGYCRDGRWYYYNCYYEPDYYFAHPVHHFSAHCVGGAAAAVVATAAVATLISALVH